MLPEATTVASMFRQEQVDTTRFQPCLWRKMTWLGAGTELVCLLWMMHTTEKPLEESSWGTRDYAVSLLDSVLCRIYNYLVHAGGQDDGLPLCLFSANDVEPLLVTWKSGITLPLKSRAEGMPPNRLRNFFTLVESLSSSGTSAPLLQTLLLLYGVPENYRHATYQRREVRTNLWGVKPSRSVWRKILNATGTGPY
jgi:hypothetical protein